MKHKTSLAIAALLSLSICAHAQQNTPKIETITIEGTHAPIAIGQIAGSVTVIDESQIKASGALTLSELLRSVAGVNLGQSGGSGSLSEMRFRGTESNHIMVLVDGVQINDGGQAGLTDFSHLLLANIERIEVLRGPQSAIWGSNAIAGIISISTKQATSQHIQGNASIAYGNKSTKTISASVSQQREKLGFSLNASSYKTDGENISRQGDEKDGYQNTSLSGGIHYNMDSFNRIKLQARLVDYKSDADGYDFSTGLVGDSDAQAKGKHKSLGINWHFAPVKEGKKDGIYSQLLSLQYSKQETDNFSNQQFERSSTGEKLRVLWSNRFEFNNHKWLNIGLEGVNEDFSQQGPSTASLINQKESNDTWAIVSDGLYALTKQLTLSASYRHDNNDIFADASSYRVGASFDVYRDWRIFVSQGKAIKNPSFVERFGYFPNSFIGNPNLQPEQQKSTEIGIEGAFDLFTLQINWFDASLKNEILGFVFLPDSGQFTAQNASSQSSREGIELSLSGNHAKLQWQLQYSYVDASEGDSIELRRARHTGSFNTTYQISQSHQVYLQADYSGTKFDNYFPPSQAGQVVSLPAYFLLSANYQYRYDESIDVNIRVSNALNNAYEDVFGYNTDGQRILASINYSW